MVVLEKIEACDGPYGIIVRVNVGEKEFYFLLCDLKVINEKSSNFVPIDDYDVWFANR